MLVAWVWLGFCLFYCFGCLLTLGACWLLTCLFGFGVLPGCFGLRSVWGYFEFWLIVLCIRWTDFIHILLLWWFGADFWFCLFTIAL